MGVYKILKKNEIFISLHRVLEKDANLCFDVSEAVLNAESLFAGMEETSTEILSVENLLDYFVVKQIVILEEAISIIEDETNKEVLKRLCAVAMELEKKYSVGDIIKFICKEYKSIIGECEGDDTLLSEDKKNLFFPLVEFCVKFQTGIIDDVFVYLAQYKWFVYINYYDGLRKKLFASLELFDMVFSEDNILSLIRSQCVQLLAIAKDVNVSSSVDDRKKCNLNERIFDVVIGVMKNAKERELIAYGDSVRRMKRYFLEINYDQQKMALFEEIHKEFDKKLNEWTEKNGSVFSQQIPSDMADIFFNGKAEWIAKLLLLTHSYRNDCLQSQFSNISHTKSFIDFVSHNIDTDEYFTYSRQNNIQIGGAVGGAFVMQTFANEKYRNELIDWLATVLELIAEHCKVQEEGLCTDFGAIVQLMQFVEAAREKKIEENGALGYGACMLIISCIEKVLRLVYKYEKKIVLSDELIQLKGLLNNAVISNVLTEDLMKGVGFFLSKYGYVGLNYRNRLAHLSDIKLEGIPTTLPYILFYLYMCVVNGIFIYYYVDFTK